MVDAAVILAGGQSRRMGQDKALLPWRGTTLLGHSMAIAQELAPRVYVVSGRDYGIAPHDPVVQWVAEPHPQGPWSGFELGLAVAIAADAAWILVLACDLPRLEVAELGHWAAGLSALPQNVSALIPHVEGQWQCLCGFYHRQCWGLWQRYRVGGGRAFQPWLNQGAQEGWVRALTDVPPGLFTNCNTLAEWQSLT
ncbi:MAG: NTP transferase domain-containing protein [Oscillatoriales cyanobacterium SM2_2_1]|nr:NTP transferase domain-containing protein [Oscillatoriales cyanobacterium SM2_2_1]